MTETEMLARIADLEATLRVLIDDITTAFLISDPSDVKRGAAFYKTYREARRLGLRATPKA